MFRVIAATDFSNNSFSALCTAMQLAQRFGGEVIFAHAMTKPPVPAAAPESIFAEIAVNAQNHFLEKLQEKVQNLFQYLNIAHREVMYQTKVVPAPFAEAMVQLMEQHKVDLVVIGSKGSSGLRRLLFGSHTLELIRLSTKPLLVIPAGHKFQGFRNITVAIRPSNFEYRSGFDLLFKFARSYNAVLYFLFVLRSREQPPELQEFLQNYNLWDKTKELSCRAGSIATTYLADAMEKHINDTSTSLLALMPSPKSLWEEIFAESITEEMTYQTRTSLYIMPSNRR